MKNLESIYEPSKRSTAWLKLKKDYIEQFTPDSFDLVPIGACYGKVQPFSHFLFKYNREKMKGFLGLISWQHTTPKVNNMKPVVK